MLKDACYNPPAENRRYAVRLALRVLSPHISHKPILNDFWEQLTQTDGQRHPWNQGHQHLRWIVTGLVKDGFPVWGELR